MSENSFAEHRLEIGQVFEGKYKILRELGRGGFGMVYLAFQQGMDRHVALKVLKPGVSASAPSAKARFLREVKIISKLRHPNTVTIHDFGESRGGVLYMVLEYVEGETLKQLLKREGAQDPVRAADIARQIAKSLAEAHRHGIVHRDLKPANIMITDIEGEKDFVKVLDFGVARLLDPTTSDLTSVGLPEGERELVGTPRYMSPEQVRGESLTGASDIYSLGLMLYETLVGEPAVQGDTTMGLITQQISPEPLALPQVHHLDPRLQEVVRIATAKPLHDRFQTAEQMSDALEQASFLIRRAREGGSGPTGEFMTNAYDSQLNHLSPPGGWSSSSDSWTGPHAAAAPGPSISLQSPLEQAPHRIREEADSVIPPFDQLPPAPDDATPFRSEEPSPPAAHEPAPRRTAAHQTAAHRALADEEDDDLLDFSLSLVKALVLGTLAVAAVYTSFLIVGAALGAILEGTARVAGALSIALALPLITALTGGGDRDRFRVVDQPLDRLSRIFLGALLFSTASAVLVAVAFSGDVVRELRTQPNWFLSGPDRATGPRDLNRRFSFGASEIIESTTRSIGIYDGAEPEIPIDALPSRPPAPTRPATQAGE